MDIILQSVGRNGTKDISFTVGRSNLQDALDILTPYVEVLGASGIVHDETVAKVSIVGAGMESHPGVAADMFEALFESNSISV